MDGIKIMGTGGYFPTKIVTNDAFNPHAEPVHKTLNRFFDGGETRRHACDSETTVMMGTKAAQCALENSGKLAKDIDLLLFYAMVPDFFYPKDNFAILDKVGMTRATTWYIDTACTSFLTMLNIAHAQIKSGSFERVMILCVTNLVNRVIDQSKNYSSLGDGAGAIIIERNEADSFIGAAEKSESEFFHHIQLKMPNQGAPIGYVSFSSDPNFRDSVVYEVIKPVRGFLIDHNVMPNDLDWFIPYQPGIRLIETWRNYLEIDADKVLLTFKKYGNLVAANLPVLLDHYLRVEPKIKRGDKALFFAIGAGRHISMMLWQF